MADEESKARKAQEDPAAKKYRKESVWHMFTGSFLSAIGSAAFFGILAKTTDILVQTFGTQAKLSGSGAETFGLETGLVMGSLMAVGIAAMYVAQHEWTELKYIQDEWLAKKNAECLSKQRQQETALTAPAIEQNIEMEHPTPCRKDGKTWEAAMAERAQTNAQQLALQ